VLIGALIISAASFNVYALARATYGVARHGEAAFQEELGRVVAGNRAFMEANRAAQDADDFGAVLAARLQHMPWFYSRPFSWLPVNTLTLFLLGVLGIRLGLFDDPGGHRRLIAGLIVFGIGAWAFSTWVPDRPPTEGSPFLREMLLSQMAAGFGLIRGMWLAFAYMGIVLLLVAANPIWLQRLAVFGWPGRTALTSYMSQIVLLDVTFSNYALGARVTPLGGLAAGIALFAANAAISRWWLRRHPYGPLEWLWRSCTYARWQPWRIDQPAPGAAAASDIISPVEESR
jgi:uncharacterized protein